MDAGAVERRLREFFAAPPDGVVAAYLFGSVARGTAGRRSDVDVAVLHATPPPLTLEGLPLDLQADLERLLGHPVEVVNLDRAPAGLIHRVLRDGRLLVDADPGARIRFEVRARNEFFDLQPIVARYRRWPVPAP
jgi:predicted nucleotidyltransferase